MAYETITLREARRDRDGDAESAAAAQRVDADDGRGARRRVARRRSRAARVRVVILTGAAAPFAPAPTWSFFAAQVPPAAARKPGRVPGRRASRSFRRSCAGCRSPSSPRSTAIALGIGCTMTLLCDIRIAAEEAKMGFLFPRMGVMAELGSTFLLPRLVGLGRACELMFTGKQYSGAECERSGLGEPGGAGCRAHARRA